MFFTAKFFYAEIKPHTGGSYLLIRRLPKAAVRTRLYSGVAE